VPFLDAACQSLRAGRRASTRSGGADSSGHLLVTATDTMVLAGPQPNVCRRRYGAQPLQGELGHEVGVRILVGAIVRSAARYGLAATPAFCYWRDHWYAAAVRVVQDDVAADATLRQMGYAAACASCFDRRLLLEWPPSPQCAVCGARVALAGPLWTGNLWVTEVLQRMLDDDRPLAAGTAVRQALCGWLGEVSAPPLFYDLHAAASFIGGPVRPPPIGSLAERLAERGYCCVRTHFAKVGIRTDADAALVLELTATTTEQSS
jgi:tRNA (guanine26-N2/guanine27-N2)-dimethyltransferase